jgi:aldose 1-epimerase
MEAITGEWAAYTRQHNLQLFTLENEFLLVTVSNYGIRIVHLLTPDAKGEPVDIIVGPETPQDFLASNNPYYGAIIGRYANRIDQGKFELNGNQYQLNCNNGTNHLHGGPDGLHQQVWDCVFQSKEKLVFTHTSPHLTESYPGNITIEVAIELKQHSLYLQYKAVTDRSTILNLTHHPFFNLDGVGSINFSSHQLQLNAHSYLPVKEDMIPKGVLSDVAATPFDFTTAAGITDRIQLQHEQLTIGNGFDHCFVRNNYAVDALGLIASVTSAKTGICMRIYTSEPGVQLYTGNFMDGTNKMKNGSFDVFRSAFCLETQHFPDSPNQLKFPSVILNPENQYLSTTVFEFSIIP